MSEGEVKRRPWWHSTGPEDNGDAATEPQVKLIRALFPRLKKLMSREELVFLEMQGEDGFFTGITKAQASSYINRVKAWEAGEKDEQKRKIREAEERAVALGYPKEQVVGQCSQCGGVLLWEAGISYRCMQCDARGFGCKRGG